MLTKAAGLALIATGDTFTWWLTASALLGAGTAMVYPTLLTAVGDVANQLWRARAVGVYRLWRDSGYAVGAVVGGVTADLWGCAPPSGPPPPSPSPLGSPSRHACTKPTRQPQESMSVSNRQHACIPPRGLTAGFGGMIALVDGMIHQQDIRRPLGIPRTIPPQRLRAVPDYALTAPAVRGARRARGVRLAATDFEWTHGNGPEVMGTGESLLMAMAARPDALGQLTGPGKPILAQHINC